MGTPSPTHSRSSTPALAETHQSPTAHQHKDGDSHSADKLCVSCSLTWVLASSETSGYDNSFSNGNGDKDSHWLSSLERVDTPSSPPQSSNGTTVVSSSPQSPSRPSSATIHAPKPVTPGRPLQPITPSASDDKERDDLRTLIQEQARTIASLESEKKTLTASLEQLKPLESSEFI